MRQTNNLHVVELTPLLTPDELKHELPISPEAAELVYVTRERIRAVVRGEDPRLIVIAGPCSVHDPDAALDYARRFRQVAARFEQSFVSIMRVYFEKPRTSVGWKGLINDPRLDGSCDVSSGLRIARKLLLDLAELGVAAATEMLDPIIPQYLADVVAWTAIGARTTESQTHREMASGLSMPVGFKNGTNGGFAAAVNAMIAASRPHRFLGIDGAGRVGVVHTAGNPDSHVVLRGGDDGPNYGAEQVAKAAATLERASVNGRMLIDCSHDNSGKNHENQPEVLDEVARQIETGSPHVLGVMIESNLVAGRQPLRPKHELSYGQSITDACVDLDMTERMLARLHQALQSRWASSPSTEHAAPSL